MGTSKLIAMENRIRNVVHTIERILEVSGTPGMSIAVTHHGRPTYVGHHGFRDVERKIAADNQTRYNINSLTKSVVAASAGIQIGKGRLDWSATVKSFLPEFESTDPVVTDLATITDLLSHRTGIVAFDAIWLQSHNTILLGHDQILKTFATLQQRQPFRNSFLYNNWGYEIVGLILERQTGQSLSQLLRADVFDALSMNRTSTSWNPDDDNEAKSYAVLHDLSPFEIPVVQAAAGTLMEAAGGVKSTIEDLMVYFSAYLEAINEQFKSGTDETPGSIFKHCRTIVSHHSTFPGDSLLEQGYGAGWARSQLPGLMGRISQNLMLADEPIVGKDSTSHLVLYHHGSMPGSTSCVAMIPSLDVVIIVLQNSLAPIDTSDFVTQLLVEAVCDVANPNDYLRLSEAFVGMGLAHVDKVKEQLDSKRQTGTTSKALSTYCGTYWNSIHNFRIDVGLHGEQLTMQFQQDEHEVYHLNHYENDTFSWWMPYDTMAKRGRYLNDFGPSFYLIHFRECDGQATSELGWAWDTSAEDTLEIFKRTSASS